MDYNLQRFEKFAKYLETIQTRDKANDGKAVPEVYDRYYHEEVWSHFDI